MSDRSQKSISASRRGFFRQIFISAVEKAEEVGREVVKRHLEPFKEPPVQTSYNPSWASYIPPPELLGPPWPPLAGPPLPMELIQDFQKNRQRRIAASAVWHGPDPEETDSHQPG